MNFEEEDYVRVYTRDTATWNALGWEGQCVLLQTMRKVGRRTGEFEVGTLDPVEALAFALRAPVKSVRVGLERMTSLGVAVIAEGKIVLPKFLRAQWARRSDAARKRESRDAQSALDSGATPPSIGSNPANVTLGHTESQPVTSGHSPIPSNPNQSQDPEGDRGAREPSARSNPRASTKASNEKPEALSSDWTPPAKAREAARIKFECSESDLDRTLPDFRYYWIEGKGAGKKRGPKSWVRTWMNRLGYLAQRGELYSAREASNVASKEHQRPYHAPFKLEPAEPKASPSEALEAIGSYLAGNGGRR